MPVTINGSGSITGLASGGISDAGAISSGVITQSALPAGSVIKVTHGQHATTGLLTQSTTFVRYTCLLYTSPSPRDKRQSRMPSSA